MSRHTSTRHPARRRPALVVTAVRKLAAVLLVAVMPLACADSRPAPDGPAPTDRPSTSTATPGGTETTGPTPAAEATRTPDPSSSPPPAWLGTRPLPRTAQGYGEMRPTPPELVDRRLWTRDFLPPPEGDRFTTRVTAVPGDVARRSTWSPECPVALDELRYVTVSFWGFDGLAHTGELLVHHRAAEPLTRVFRALYEARFPIEQMRVTSAAERGAAPTGDGNVTGAFNCRPSRGSTRWSEHAKGLAVDVNPFHNPYARGDIVLPELAGAYTDRARNLPGMIQPGDVVTTAFAEIGWGWGGDWRSAKDWMHFSAGGA